MEADSRNCGQDGVGWQLGPLPGGAAQCGRRFGCPSLFAPLRYRAIDLQRGLRAHVLQETNSSRGIAMTGGARSQGSSDQRSFRRFLDWLDEGADSGGQKYLEIRQRLAAYFERKNCLPADDLADETLSRVARRLEEEGSIEGTTPARYCYIVARFVFLEHYREAKLIGADPSRLSASPATTDINEEARTTHLNCLETCLRKLDDDQRELIIEYYRGERRAKIFHRHSLAHRLGLSMNAVTIRACRIRDRLEGCVRRCSETQGDDRISGLRLI
jgi:DNA-directed RNA polymerase specialized sigma24 family protein